MVLLPPLLPPPLLLLLAPLLPRSDAALPSLPPTPQCADPLTHPPPLLVQILIALILALWIICLPINIVLRCR